VNLQPGVRLGPYEILAPLGAGGMGEVYRALDPRLRREVAIKILPASLFHDPVRRRRLEQEARAAGALNHPNLLTIYELGSHDDAPFIVSELLVGETLRSKLRSGPLPQGQAADYALQIAKGLAAAHDKGIVHRDLKPENIFVTTDDRVKILDFGLAKVNVPMQNEFSDTDALTGPGTVMGTLAYMSPEQALGRPVDARTDVFSFGAIVFEMLGGRPAFHKASAPETIAAILAADPISTVPDGLPPALVSIVRHCLEKEPERRFRSGHDVAIALESGSAPMPIVGPAPFPAMKAMKMIAGALAVVVIAAVIWIVSTRGAGSPHIDSLAVLPLRELSGTSDRYFADGVTEELITRLAQIHSLRVVPRSSAERYAGTRKSLREIGQELNVTGIVTGSVLRSGSNVRVTAQLVDARTEQNLWADEYERPLGDVLTLQDELSRAIVDRIRIRLSPADQQRLTSARPISPAAHDAYLKGLYNFNRTDPEGFSRAITFFQEAIGRDPNYAAAYAGLATCYTSMGFFGILVPTEAYPTAKEAALTALKLDPDLADAHVSLGIVLANYEWNWKAADQEFRRAIELNPNSELAHTWIALLLLATGRTDEALSESRRVIELSPLGRVANQTLPWTYYQAHKFDIAIQQYQKAIPNDPDDPELHEGLGDAYVAAGRDPEAFSAYQRWAQVAGFPAAIIAELDRAYRTGGMRDYWRKRLELEDQEVKETGDVWPYRMALLHARLHDTEQTLSWLERAYAEHGNRLVFLHVEPAFDFLSRDTRFQNLMHRVGLV
jgi:eukaryotic-like serine/threonine-protein kinase